MVDFIGIGAPRCGTTWIYRCLAEHPQICVSKPKETRFFDKDDDYAKGIGLYQSYFSHCLPQKTKGEFSVQYLVNEKSPERIRQFFPQAKLIVSLRNPVERAYSHYHFHRSAGFTMNPTFETALKEDRNYVAHGLYLTLLKRWLDYFPPEQLLILIYEDALQDPIKFLQGIYDFLKVDKDFIPPSAVTVINPSTKTYLKTFFIRKAMHYFKQHCSNKAIINVLKMMKINTLGNLWLKKDFSSPDVEKVARAPMEPGTREYLQKTYAQEIEGLERFLNRDLSFWQ